MPVTKKIHVTGKVQGVFYRQSAKKMADSLGITGTIKNEKDGTVTIIAFGNEKNIGEFILWCYDGPPAATVAAVEVTEIPNTSTFEEFLIVR